MREYDYTMISDEEKTNILNNEIKNLEAQHWALCLIEPNKLQESQQHLAWQQQVTTLESSLNGLKRKKSEIEQ